MNLQKLLSYTRRAVDKYMMIEDGDKIAIGVSGGKDSMSLLLALKTLQRFYPKKFDLEAVTVCLGFPDSNFSIISEFCKKIGVNYTVYETEIGPIVFDVRKEKNPCSLCSKMRKGALIDKAVELGCNKIALGHNKDDAMQTLFMSLFLEGRIHSFAPITYMDKAKVHTIRPLIYAPEGEIKSFTVSNNIPIFKNPCPAAGNTTREDMKTFIKELRKKYDHFDNKIIGAMERAELNGWRD